MNIRNLTFLGHTSKTKSSFQVQAIRVLGAATISMPLLALIMK